MRYALSSLFAVWTATLLLAGCGLLADESNATDDPEQPGPDTYVRATLNGAPWSAKSIAEVTESWGYRWISLIGDTLHKSHYPYTETISFIIIYDGIKSYSLAQSEVQLQGGTQLTGASYYEQDGDALIASYHTVGDSLKNHLTVTSYDSTSGIATGTFRTTLVVDSSDAVSEPGEMERRRADTLRFTNGEFRVDVRDDRSRN
jgi:hypothetical protein